MLCILYHNEQKESVYKEEGQNRRGNGRQGIQRYKLSGLGSKFQIEGGKGNRKILGEAFIVPVENIKNNKELRRDNF